MANPHRFRHTFASDMVRAGMSLPALMQLMGHADIETTMHYVKVSPQDVYLQYTRAAAQCIPATEELVRRRRRPPFSIRCFRPSRTLSSRSAPHSLPQAPVTTNRGAQLPHLSRLPNTRRLPVSNCSAAILTSSDGWRSYARRIHR